MNIVSKSNFITPIAHPTVMFRADEIKNVGGYRREFKYCEDLDLWLRCVNSKLIFDNIDEYLVFYRQSDSVRVKDHWKYNVLARIKNFKFQACGARFAGILIISLWAITPSWLARFIYNKIIFQKN